MKKYHVSLYRYNPNPLLPFHRKGETPSHSKYIRGTDTMANSPKEAVQQVMGDTYKVTRREKLKVNEDYNQLLTQYPVYAQVTVPFYNNTYYYTVEIDIDKVIKRKYTQKDIDILEKYIKHIALKRKISLYAIDDADNIINIDAKNLSQAFNIVEKWYDENVPFIQSADLMMSDGKNAVELFTVSEKDTGIIIKTLEEAKKIK